MFQQCGQQRQRRLEQWFQRRRCLKNVDNNGKDDWNSGFRGEDVSTMWTTAAQTIGTVVSEEKMFEQCGQQRQRRLEQWFQRRRCLNNVDNNGKDDWNSGFRGEDV